MKKSIITYKFLLIAACLMFSCNDEFLERAPLDEISAETFWNTESDLKVYNNRIYDLARNDNDVPILMGHHNGFSSHRWSMWHMDGFSDNTAPRHSRHNRYQQVRSGKHTVPDGPQWYGYRNGGWGFIRTINIGLENYGNASVTQEVKDLYAAEARLFRAWFYADKVSKFGDVQWIDKELNIDSPELEAPRTPRTEVMDNVLADLNFATQHLPDDWGDGGGPGRLNRWAALLVKARICLFEGTWRKYHGMGGETPWLQAAADASKELMDNGPYSLYSTGDPLNDYNTLHRIESDLTGVSEVMYWRRYEQGIFTNHVSSYHRAYNGGATKSLVEDYLCTDGLPITLSDQYQGDAQIEDVFMNRDPRLRQSVLHPEDVAKFEFGNNDTRPYPRLVGMNGGIRDQTGYHIIKVYTRRTAHATYNTSDSPAIILRFAEALLINAEALAELGTITQDDLDASINLLRDRVGMPHMTIDVPMDPRYADDGVSALIAEIRRERRVELFLEGHRYEDLRRWKQGKKLEQADLGIRFDAAAVARYEGANVATEEVDGVPYISVYKGTDWENPVFDEGKHYLWPIPISVISQNTSVKQNPGW
ncbi:MAG: RagB/SusD family nutrient uptake outer membrane protein [Saprospiraceae bacterium]|nr:RagB/SusD family nutrient uptake outer membrane protein [Saprospiraceae bacterium]